jgi:hypothetical protein
MTMTVTSVFNGVPANCSNVTNSVGVATCSITIPSGAAGYSSNLSVYYIGSGANEFACGRVLVTAR